MHQIPSGGAAECLEGTSPTAVDSALLSSCVHQIPSGGAAECHEGTSPTTALLQQFIVLCCHDVCIRFPQVELLNAMKVRLLQHCYSSS